MTETAAPTGIAKYIPMFGWLPDYPRAWLRTDIVAGLIAAAVVIPQAMAYATIAGLPIQSGLYVALVPMLVYVLLGTSRPLSVSTTSSLSLLTVSALAAAVGTSSSTSDRVTAAATLAFLVGLFLVAASLLRMGFVADFISLPVLTGFKAGIGVVIFVSQLGKVLGLSIPSESVSQTLLAVVEGLGQINWPTVLLSLLMLAILLLLPRVAPRIPAPLVAVVVGIGLSSLLNVTELGIATIGQIPSGLPSLALPDPSLLGSLWLPALGIALMSFTESTAASRAFRRHGEPVPDPNRELFALGVANLGGSLFQAYPAGGGTSQTAVNSAAGARSQLAQLVTFGVVVLTLLFLAPVISLMPEATLGSLMLVAAAGLINIGEFRNIAKFGRRELIWALIAFFGVMILGTLQGILVAVIISMISLIAQANRPPVYALGRKPDSDVYLPLDEYPTGETTPTVLIARTEGRLYFANIAWVLEKLGDMVKESDAKVLVLDCSAIPDIEYTALKSMSEFEEQLRENGITLRLARLDPTALYAVEHSTLGATLGQERIIVELENAVSVDR